ncbi:EamA family transporter [Nocardioides mangrovicus]|uniref:EamA family transporter n=1 Tax=Nocardioides mangrovicus TaxID=2478913 RepID=UPI001E622A07|nr:DMT family transporter [Nocardioides mangrovicus]
MSAGLVFAVITAVSFGLSGSLARGLMDAGWTSNAAVVARILIAGVLLLPLGLRSARGHWSAIRANVPMLITYGLLAVAAAQLCYFNAVAHMQVGVALLVEYVAPVAVVLWLWLRRGERPSRLTALGGAVAAVGLVLVLDLLSGAQVSLVGVVWALGAMVGAATFFVLSGRQEGALPGPVLACAGLLIGGTGLLLLGLVGVLPLAATTHTVAFEGFTTPWWVTVLGLGVVCAAVPYSFGILAARRLGSRLASFVGLLEVLSALLWAWLLLGELPRGIQIAGGVLVLAGVVLVKLGERAVQPTGLPSAAVMREG